MINHSCCSSARRNLRARDNKKISTPSVKAALLRGDTFFLIVIFVDAINRRGRDSMTSASSHFTVNNKERWGKRRRVKKLPDNKGSALWVCKQATCWGVFWGINNIMSQLKRCYKWLNVCVFCLCVVFPFVHLCAVRRVPSSIRAGVLSW